MLYIIRISDLTIRYIVNCNDKINHISSSIYNNNNDNIDISNNDMNINISNNDINNINNI